MKEEEHPAKLASSVLVEDASATKSKTKKDDDVLRLADPVAIIMDDGQETDTEEAHVPQPGHRIIISPSTLQLASDVEASRVPEDRVLPAPGDEENPYSSQPSQRDSSGCLFNHT
jgi:hypothetical protein